MKQLDFTLTSKKQVTHDVYELIFTASEPVEVQPGQYVLFILPKSGLRRAYSVAYTNRQTFIFIIKQIEGGIGSTEICSLECGEVIPGLCPLGHFVLRDTTEPKLFIGTGTGFAPLYFMVRALEEIDSSIKSHFIFGVRERRDTFYLDELKRMESMYPNFSSELSLSREDAPGFSRGYVTDYLQKPELVGQFKEFYICGSPAMVKDSRVNLEAIGVAKEQIFFEQY